VKVEIYQNEQQNKGFFILHRADLAFEKFNGDMSQPVARMAIERGDAVAVLMYDSQRKKIILVKQFRFPMYLVTPQQSWLLEVVAGMIEAGQTPAESAVREMEEEAGFVVPEDSLRFLTTCCPSPGGLTERIHLYCVDVGEGYRRHAGGGLAEEAEDIELVELDYQAAYAMLERGEIQDAKTIICLLWVQKELRGDEPVQTT
jgi:nudix-type nucleoside diphosphatase (YffH/AdpP family)